MHITRTSIAIASAAFVSATLLACGGGGGGDNASTAGTGTTTAPTGDTTTPTGGGGATTPGGSTSPVVTTSTLSGVAATGMAMSGATITIRDAAGTTAVKTSDNAGGYSFDVTDLVAPLVITAETQAGDTHLLLTSMVAEKPAAGVTGTANVTPLTHAMAALLAPNGNPEELSSPDVAKAVVTPAKLADVTSRIRMAIDNILKDAGLDPAKFDPVSTTFAANRLGADRVLEMVHVEVTGQGVALTNSFVPDDGNGSASVQITRLSTSAATLPAPPAGTVLGEFDHIATLFEACLAAAPAQRVIASTGGVPTTLSAACAATPLNASYKSGGLTGVQRFSSLLQGEDYTGAKFDKPDVLYTETDGKVVFRMAYKTAAGAGGVMTDVVRKTNPSGKPYVWELIGNQRDYDSGVDARVENVTELNPGNTKESSKSQYRAAIRLFFNPINTAGRTVQTVRVKGPGLPPAGIVMHRSNVCGTNEYMTVTNKTGALLNSSNQPILWNTGGANNFKLAAELKSGTYDWSKVGGNSGWRSSQMTDAEIAAIPSYATYTWELWLFGTGFSYRSDITNSTMPDVTYTQRLSSRPPSVGSLKTLPWNSIDAIDFLNPSSALASSQTTATVSWKKTNEPVDSVNADGSRSKAANGSTPAFFSMAIGDSDAVGVKPSATSTTVTPTNDFAGTVSLTGITGATPSIPNCAIAQFPAIDTVAGPAGGAYGTYREAVIRSRSYSLARKYVINAWNNFAD